MFVAMSRAMKLLYLSSLSVLSGATGEKIHIP